jgi:hypothetical protein
VFGLEPLQEFIALQTQLETAVFELDRLLEQALGLLVDGNGAAARALF